MTCDEWGMLPKVSRVGLMSYQQWNTLLLLQFLDNSGTTW
jgi:hypothetical protein